MKSFKLLKLVAVPCLLVVMSFSACDFFGDDGDDGSGDTGYAIGDTGPSGVGIVFYITDGGRHGLEAATVDQSTGIAWISGGYTQSTLNNNTGTAIGTGSANTDAIIAQAVADGNNNMLTYAAGIARSYGGGGKTDWFLPSRNELNLIWDNLVGNGSGGNSGVGGLASDKYWSSSEGDASYAWYQNFDNGFQNNLSKSNTFRVRAVRAF